MIRKLYHSDSGASLLEFALLTPVLAFLLIGLIDVGRYSYYAVLAANAARAGTQYGAQNLTNATDTVGMEAAATNDAQSLPQWNTPKATTYCMSSGTVVTCPAAPATPAPGEIYYVKVVVTGSFNGLINYPGIPSSGIPVSGTSAIRVVNQ